MLSSPSPAIAVIAIGKIQYRRQKKDYRKQNPVFIRVQKRKNRKYHDQYTHYDMKHIQGIAGLVKGLTEVGTDVQKAE